jgi:tetratricopeptide (TPR) repeat protein
MNYGLALGRLERWERALEEFRLATAEPDANYNLALVQTEAGRYAEAARSLEAALRLQPNFEAAREQLRVVAHQAAEAENQPAAQPAALADAAPPVTEMPTAESDVNLAADLEADSTASENAAPMAPLASEDSLGMTIADNDVPSTYPPTAGSGGTDVAAAALDSAGMAALLDDLIAAALRDLRGVYERITCELEAYAPARGQAE